MASYYYLIASLPEIRSDGQMPISYDEFLAMCETNVSRKCFDVLKNLTLSSKGASLLDRWNASYQNLMNELNHQRSVRLGRAFATEYDKDTLTASVAASAIGAKNPLEAERILLDYEFECLDELVGLHTFDDIFLFGYAIKLKLLQRQDSFEHEAGKKEFERLFEQIQERVYSL
jgi:hypothetical protein